MKFFTIVFFISIVALFYGLYIDSINVIVSFGFLALSSSIIFTSIGKENIISAYSEFMDEKMKNIGNQIGTGLHDINETLKKKK